MAALKISKLPDRVPVKIGLSITPTLNASLNAYADAYRQAYGENIAIADLIPSMLDHFLSSDRTFQKQRGSQRD